MPQFLARPEDVRADEGTAVLRGDEARHLTVVLRARPGERVLLFDGCGRRWAGKLAEGHAGEARIEHLEPLPGNEPVLELELIQALTKGETWEWILEKGTELGVTRFRPVLAERSVGRAPKTRWGGKRQRWEKRVVAAAKQCERATLPLVSDPEDLAPCLRRLEPPRSGEARMFLAERRSGRAIRATEPPPSLVRVAVGPEGGWGPAERKALAEAGFRPVSLGPRILRAETAALAGLTVVQTRWGDVEGLRSAW